MIQFCLLISRQGKTRLSKWYAPASHNDRTRMAREVSTLVLARSSKLCNVIEYKADVKIVYKRYASLYFVVGVDPEDNELLALEIVHQFVEVLDRYFGNVCELDLIFNFHKAYYILDELILGGEIQDSSRRSVLKSIAVQDQLTEQALEGKAET